MRLAKLARSVAKWFAIAFVLLIGLIVLFFAWALPPAKPRVVSSDIAALRQKVYFDMPISSARWETVEYPEDNGGFLPTSVDYVDLVAEIELADPSWFKSLRNAEPSYRPFQEKYRPWFTQPFKDLIGNGSKDIDQAGGLECKKLEAVLAKSGRAIEGAVCAIGSRVIITLPLANYENGGTASGE